MIGAVNYGGPRWTDLISFGHTGGLLPRGKPAILPSRLVLVVKPTSRWFERSISTIKKTPTRGVFLWWAQMDSNQRPDRYERPALTN